MRHHALSVLFVSASMSLAAGCSSDATSDVGVELDGGETGNAGDDGDGASPDGDSGGQATGLTGADETGDSGGEPPGGSGPLDTCSLDCGGLGTCTIDKGLMSCDCDEGAAAVGSTCILCEAATETIALDIAVQSFTLDLTLDGEPFPSSPYQDGHFVLVERTRGDEVVVGNSNAGMLNVGVLHGDYELVWRHESGGTAVPRNSNAVLGRVGIDVSGALRLPEDGPFSVGPSGELVGSIETTVFTGEFRINGEPAPESPYEHGVVVLVDPATGDEVYLGATSERTFAVRALPGTYEAHYRVLQGNDVAPHNKDAYLRDVTIGEGSDPTTLDIPVVTIEGDFTVDGAPAPPSPYERGQVMLRDLATGDEFPLGDTSEGSFSVPVVPSEYEMVYRYVTGSAVVPRNQRAVVRGVSVSKANGLVQTVSGDLPTVTVTGAITVGGGIPPTDSANSGELTLQGVDSEEEVVLGVTTDGGYEAIVLPANFEIVYGQTTSSGLVPANTAAVIRTVDMTIGELPGAIDVPMSAVSGEVLLNGATPPDSEYDDGRIYLRNTESGDSVLLGNTRLGSVDSQVVPGTYDVYYVVETPGVVVPQNSGAYLDTVVVSPGTPLDLPLDIPVYDLAGIVTVNAVAPPQGDTERANLVLEAASGDDILHLGEVSAGSFGVPVTAGTYVVYYEMLQTTGALPSNQRAGLACYVLGD